MQGDGNAVLYLNGLARWASNTSRSQGRYLLCVQGDENVVIYLSNAANDLITAIWASKGIPLPRWRVSICKPAANGEPPQVVAEVEVEAASESEAKNHQKVGSRVDFLNSPGVFFHYICGASKI